MKKIAIMSIFVLSLFGLLFSHHVYAAPGGGGAGAVQPCSDSDRSQANRPGRGADRLVKGTTRGRLVLNGAVANPRVTHQDECWGNSGIREFYCANATDIADRNVQCQRRETCYEGRCRPFISPSSALQSVISEICRRYETCSRADAAVADLEHDVCLNGVLQSDEAFLEMEDEFLGDTPHVQRGELMNAIFNDQSGALYFVDTNNLNRCVDNFANMPCSVMFRFNPPSWGSVENVFVDVDDAPRYFNSAPGCSEIFHRR